MSWGNIVFPGLPRSIGSQRRGAPARADLEIQWLAPGYYLLFPKCPGVFGFGAQACHTYRLRGWMAKNFVKIKKPGEGEAGERRRRAAIEAGDDR